MVICLERGADLHMAQLMPLPLTVSCSSKIQIGFTFLVPAHLGNPGQTAVRRVCVRARARNDHSNLPLTAANLLLLTRRCADAAAVTVTLVTRASKQTCVASNLFSPAPFLLSLLLSPAPFSFFDHLNQFRNLSSSSFLFAIHLPFSLHLSYHIISRPDWFPIPRRFPLCLHSFLPFSLMSPYQDNFLSPSSFFLVILCIQWHN